MCGANEAKESGTEEAEQRHIDLKNMKPHHILALPGVQSVCACVCQQVRDTVTENIVPQRVGVSLWNFPLKCYSNIAEEGAARRH